MGVCCFFLLALYEGCALLWPNFCFDVEHGVGLEGTILCAVTMGRMFGGKDTKNGRWEGFSLNVSFDSSSKESDLKTEFGRLHRMDTCWS